VTVTLDLGQGRELAHLRERALAAGAVRAHVLDAREEFVRGYILPALQTGAFSPGRDFEGTSLSRPLIARRLVDVARMEAAGAVAHGCGRADPDRAPLEVSVRMLDPALRIIAPVSEWGMSEADLVAYARSLGIPVATTPRQRVDANVWGRLLYGAPSDGDFKLTRSIADAPSDAAFMEIEFEAGVPVRANGVEMPLIEMIESIETIAGTHGVGRLPGPTGSVAESPAAVVLHAAHSELIRREGHTTGAVRVKLLKGSCEITTTVETVA
jgi:argininosuccinate synthase